MDQLLEQLLQLARIEKGVLKATISEIDLGPLLLQVADRWKQQPADHPINITVAIAPGTKVEADRICLEIMLDNLVSNAVKYGRPNGHIQLSWQSATWELKVIDDGIGIPAAQLPYIFDRFYRADASRSSAIKGNGLGLSIVQKLANLQGIGVHVTSEEGQGTTFTLQFR